jgi:hypothetical protein
MSTKKTRKPVPKKIRREAARKGGKAIAARRRAPKATADRRAALKSAIVARRLRGEVMRTIAAALDISLGYTCELCAEAMKETAGLTAERAEALRDEQLAFMDAGQSLVARKLFDETLEVKDEKPDGSVMALAEFEKINKLSMTMIKYGERIAKLAGIDAPEKVDLGNQKVLNAETLAAWLAERRGKASEPAGG